MYRVKSMQPHNKKGLVARILITLLLVLAGAVALIFGVVIVAVLLGAAVILFIFLYLRNWWVRHKLGLNVRPKHHAHTHEDGATIEGEYTVAEPDDDKSDRRP
ncbi:MAG: hypothetical protein WBR15_10465 [Gammaproteobacteria bacterium]